MRLLAARSPIRMRPSREKPMQEAARESGAAMFGSRGIPRCVIHEHVLRAMQPATGNAVNRHGDRLRFLCCLAILASGCASAASISVVGTLAYNDATANGTAVRTFGILATSTVTIQSYGYGGSGSAPGGTNLAGAVIPAGGFDPYVSLFAGAGPTATFIASNDDGLCPPGAPDVNGGCHDSTLNVTLDPGTYTVVVSAFDNMSLAENLGTGTLGDGFIGLGNYAYRTNAYAIDISGTGIDEIFTDGFQ